MDEFPKYLKKHTQLIFSIIFVAFLVLAAGEYYLYRQIRYVNQMVSEGFMQVKDEMSLTR